MSEFKRRPFLKGNTNVPVVNQPYITGSVRCDVDREFTFDGGDDAYLTIETEVDTAEIEVTSRTLDGIVEAINEDVHSAPLVTAEAVDGCVRIISKTSGDGAFLRIHPTTTSLPDLAPYIGLPLYPNPSATVNSYDLPQSEVRPLTQANPPGTVYIAEGEDRSSTAMCRVTDALARNLDTIWADSDAPIAIPVVIEIPDAEAPWDDRLILSTSGTYEGRITSVHLGAYEGLSRIFTGIGLSNASTLCEIAQYFGVLDSQNREMTALWVNPAGEWLPRTVRVAAVTRGNLDPDAYPNFLDDDSAPVGGVSFAADIPWGAPGGGSILESDSGLVKQSAKVIASVEQGCVIYCPLATFETKRVLTGDKVTIASSTSDEPTGRRHNGDYYVDHVIGEDRLVVKPMDGDQVIELNDEGVLGTATVVTTAFRSNTSETDGIHIHFHPPLPAIPAGGIKLVLGIEIPRNRLRDEDVLAALKKSYDVLGGFAVQQFWINQSLGGVLGGMGQMQGGGFYAKADTRGFRIDVAQKSAAAMGVPSVTTWATEGTLLPVSDGHAGMYLYAGDDADQSFVVSDVGKVVMLSEATAALYQNEIFFITEYIDAKHVRVVPGEHRPAYEGAAALSAVTIRWPDESIGELKAAIVAVASPTFTEDEVEVASARAGFVFVGDQKDADDTDGRPPGKGFLHLERCRLFQTAVPDDPDVIENYQTIELVSLSGSGAAAKAQLPAGFGPLNSNNIFPLQFSAGVKYNEGYATPSLLRVHNSKFAGWYWVKNVGTNYVYLVHLDLSEPDFTSYAGGDLYASFYNVRMGTGVPTDSGHVGMALFADGIESEEDEVAALQVGWRGSGHGVRAALNDRQLIALRTGDGAHGNLIYAIIYGPAAGIYLKTWDDDALKTGPKSALELDGAVWQHSGAFFTETGFLAYQQVSPGAVPPDTDPASAPFTAVGRSVLGNAPQMYPAGTTDPAISADFEAPDSTTFHVDHHIIATITPADVGSAGAEKLVGQVLEADLGLATDQFLIVGYRRDGPAQARLALYNSDGVDLGAPAAAVDYRILGRRWYRGRVDVAEWMQIGTAIGNADRLPTVTIGRSLQLQDDKEAGLASDFLTKATEGGLSGYPFQEHRDGYGIGLQKTLASMTNVHVAYSTYALSAGWVQPLGTSGHIWHHGWAEDAEEPMLPIPNVACITVGSTTDPVGAAAPPTTPDPEQYDVDRPGNLLTDDFALEFISGSEATIMRFANRDELIGTFNVWNPSASADTVRIWTRGTRGVNPKYFSFEAKLIVFAGNQAASLDNAVAKFQLVDSNGNVLEDSEGNPIESAEFNIQDAATSQEFTADLELNELHGGAGDILDENALETTGVHLCLYVTLPAEDAGNAFYLRIVQFKLEQKTRPKKVYGPLEVLGPIRATGFRNVSPVPGFESVGPVQAELLHSHEFARLVGDVATGDGGFGSLWPNLYGILEGPGVGLVKVDENYDGVADTWIMPTFDQSLMFRKGIHSTAIRLYHPYFDPLWYFLATFGNSVGDIVAPGKTGFLIPFNPPHGAKLTGLHFNLSFLPARYWNNGVTAAAWQIWNGHSLPDEASEAQWKAVDNWANGVTVRFWRYNCIDFGQSMNQEDENIPTIGYAGDASADHGFAECLWEADINMNSTEIPAVDGNDVGSSKYASWEHFHKQSVSLVNRYRNTNYRQALIVDRRQYSYCMTVEFWGGCRDRDASGWTYREEMGNAWSPDTNKYYTEGFGRMARGVLISTGTDPYASAETTHGPPVVKFRGARLDWVTDRG